MTQNAMIARPQSNTRAERRAPPHAGNGSIDGDERNENTDLPARKQREST
jgi:hypothetical protein